MRVYSVPLMGGHWGATMWRGVHHVSHAVDLPTDEWSKTGSLLLRCDSSLCTSLTSALIFFDMPNRVKRFGKSLSSGIHKMGSTIKKAVSRPSSPDPSRTEQSLSTASTTRISTTPQPEDHGTSASASPQDHHASSAQPETSEVAAQLNIPAIVIDGPQSPNAETSVSSLRRFRGFPFLPVV